MSYDYFKHSNTIRVLFIGFLILLLLIPMGMVESVIYERSDLYRQASYEINESWGREQLISGPILSLSREKYYSENSGWSYDKRYKYVQPETINIDAQVTTQIRYRGIYQVPVYTTDLSITGQFHLQHSSLEDDNGRPLELNEAYIQIPIQSARALKNSITFIWNGEQIRLKPKRSDQSDSVVMFAKLPDASFTRDQAYDFEYSLSLAGSERLSFISMARNSTINMQSNWSSPSFFGMNLPTEHDISHTGFTGLWQLSDVTHDFGYGKSETINNTDLVNEPTFGVRFVQAVDRYQTVTRATKYAVLFIGLTFMVYFFTELLAKVQLHPIQYLFVGMANCIFYLLLLSLTEHTHFNLAYFISAMSSTILIALYSLSVLKDRIKASIVFIIISSLYGYLFVTLNSEGFALLVGSIGLFAILSTVMYLTRDVDWHKPGQ